MPALIFDFDGVIADSEDLANQVLAEFICGLGFACTPDDCAERYTGLRWADTVPLIERDTGAKLPDDFAGLIRGRIHARYATELNPVKGVEAVLERFRHVPRCIASSSSLTGIAHALSVMGMADTFGAHVYSGELVSRGKPAPDLFLYAAGKLGVAPERCLVIEDSINGVKAAVAANMAVIGLLAGSHIRGGHDVRLREAGATFIAPTWDEVANIAERFFRAMDERQARFISNS